MYVCKNMFVLCLGISKFIRCNYMCIYHSFTLPLFFLVLLKEGIGLSQNRLQGKGYKKVNKKGRVAKKVGGSKKGEMGFFLKRIVHMLHVYIRIINNDHYVFSSSNHQYEKYMSVILFG